MKIKFLTWENDYDTIKFLWQLWCFNNFIVYIDEYIEEFGCLRVRVRSWLTRYYVHLCGWSRWRIASFRPLHHTIKVIYQISSIYLPAPSTELIVLWRLKLGGAHPPKWKRWWTTRGQPPDFCNKIHSTFMVPLHQLCLLMAYIASPWVYKIFEVTYFICILINFSLCWLFPLMFG